MDNNNSKNTENIESGEKKRGLMLTLLGLCYIVTCSYLPLAVSVNMGEWLTLAVALGICAVGILALTKMAGSFKPVAGFIIIIAIFAVLGGAVLPMALLVAFASATCAYAWLALKHPSLPVWLLPVIPAAVGVVLTRDASGALLALATLPCALTLAFSIKNELQRVGAICRISAAICAFVAVAFIFTVYSVTGELSFSAAKELIDVTKVELTLAIDGAVSEMSSQLGVDTVGLDVSNITELAVGAAFNLLPAIVITVANIAAYLIHSLFMSVYFITEEQKKQALPMLSFEMSLTSSIVYIAALALSLLLVSENVALWGTAAENIALVLAPGLILTALAGIRALSMRNGPSCLGTLLYLVVIFMLASLSGIVIMVVALAGAVLNIVAHIAKRKSQSK